jgi:hypothetical protein
VIEEYIVPPNNRLRFDPVTVRVPADAIPHLTVKVVDDVVPLVI